MSSNFSNADLKTIPDSVKQVICHLAMFGWQEDFGGFWFFMHKLPQGIAHAVFGESGTLYGEKFVVKGDTATDFMKLYRRAGSMRTHETVGRYFRAWDSSIYLCTSWHRASGFWMRVIVKGDADGARGVGEEACISERAIGRTYHRLPDHEIPAGAPLFPEHAQPCNCYICEGREG